MTDFINQALQWLNLHPNWASLATFIISAGESIAVIGTIIPGTITMTAIGTLAGANVIPLWSTLVYAILGAILGDGISYYLGHHFKSRMRQIWPFRNHLDWLQKGELFFHKHGGKSILIGRFVGPVRAIIPVIAGMLGFKASRFFYASIPAAAAWAPIYMLPGILLGAVSLELPPDMALHVVLMLILALLTILFCAWLVMKIFMLIGYRIDRMLNNFWKRLQNSHYAKIITIALKHHDPKQTHGQLVLAFYFILVTCSLFGLIEIVKHTASSNLFINHVLFHFFRSLRSPITDNAMIMFTMLGEKSILILLAGILVVWLFSTKKTYLAWHTLALIIMAAGSIWLVKNGVHSVRPGGIIHSQESYSFPSGHTTLSAAFFVGFALLLSIAHPSKRRLFVFVGVVLAFLVAISRLYLSAHWFTDVLAGWLLSTALLLLIVISYNRKKNEESFNISQAFLFLLISFFIYSAAIVIKFPTLKNNYALDTDAIYTMPIQQWWKRTNINNPIHRINCFGLRDQLLNVQWAGNLKKIETVLLDNGWERPPERNWISVLLRLSDVRSSEYLPLVSPLHLDKKPVLVLIKPTSNKKRVMVLRLWDSNIKLSPKDQNLWVGTISMIPRTYSWLFKKKTIIVNVHDELLPKKLAYEFEVKEVKIPYTVSHGKNLPFIILIKPN